MKGCISCDTEECLLYPTKEGTSCGPCFVRHNREINMENFLRVRVDIGDDLKKSQKKDFNKICESFERHRLLELLGFKLKI